MSCENGNSIKVVIPDGTKVSIPEGGLEMQKLRVFFGFSTEEIADKMGISESTYKHLEYGYRPIRRAYIQSLAYIYGISEHDIRVPEIKD